MLPDRKIKILLRTNRKVSVISYGMTSPPYLTVFAAKRKLDSQLILPSYLPLYAIDVANLISSVSRKYWYL